MVAKSRLGLNALLLWTLFLLFSLRVAGQAVQLWIPQAYLPSFEDFQGSDLPYWALLSAQLVILATMFTLARRVQTGAFRPGRPIAIGLAWAGALYMVASLARIAVGLTIAAAPAWFRAWIPAAFHVVLAAYVLTLAHACRFPQAIGTRP